MMMKISYQIFKIILVVPISVFIAEYFGLNFPGSAGIIAVLCVQPTRKRSFLIAWHRLAAGLLSMVFAYFIFNFLGYYAWTVGLLLLVFIPITHALKIAPGIVTSLVVIFHFYESQAINQAIILNEIAIMSIGIGVALIINLYMPSLDKNLEQLKKDIEVNYQQIFRNFASYLKGDKKEITPKRINELKEQLADAEKFVQKNIENTFSRHAYQHQQYFSMRHVHIDCLDQMIRIIKPLDVKVKKSHQIAELFDGLADTIYPDNAVSYHLDQVGWLKSYFAKDTLPKSREEFEVRASLFQLLAEVEHYLMIKNQTVKEKLT